MPVLAAAAKAAAKKILTALVKKKAQDVASRNKSNIALFIIGIFLAIMLVIVSIFGGFGKIVCSIANTCEGEESYQVVTSSDTYKVAMAGDRLRNKANSEATQPGKSFRQYVLNDTWAENTDLEVEEEKKTGAVLTGGGDIGDTSQYFTGVSLEGTHQCLINRWAKVSQHYGQKIDVSSAFRSIEYQQQLLDEAIVKYGSRAAALKWVAEPGKSRHNYGDAMDVNGFAQTLTNADLKPFGLHKPLSWEDWHSECIETIGTKAGDAIIADGYGPNGGGGDQVPEPFVLMLTFQQADSWELNGTEGDYKAAAKDSPISKTYYAAKEMKKRVDESWFKNTDIKTRAKNDKWNINDYMEYIRFEAHKCFLLGDDFESPDKIFGSKTPCAELNDLLGKQFIPTELTGVIGQVIATTACVEFNEEGACVKEIRKTTIKYKDTQEFLQLYKDISLFAEEDKDDFKDTMQEMIKQIFEDTLVGGFEIASLPEYITPFEEGTYKLEAKFGTEVDGEMLDGALVTTTGKNVPVYSTANGTVISVEGDRVIISHGTGYHSEFVGLKEKIVKKGNTVLQGQMIGAMSDAKKVTFKICKEVNGTGDSTKCANSVNPEQAPTMLDLNVTEDLEKSKTRSAEYPKMKTDAVKSPVFMPGFSALGGLGSLSARYETGTDDPASKAYVCVNNAGDIGKLSCGSYQIAAGVGTMDTFLSFLKTKHPQYYNHLAGLPYTMSQFAPAWKQLWERDKMGFYNAQHEFIAESHYLPLKRNLEKIGINTSHRHPVIEDVLWSIGVQHGSGQTNLFKRAGVDNTMSDEEWIRRVYTERMKVDIYFSSSSSSIKAGVKSRFEAEMNDALARLN